MEFDHFLDRSLSISEKLQTQLLSKLKAKQTSSNLKAIFQNTSENHENINISLEKYWDLIFLDQIDEDKLNEFILEITSSLKLLRSDSHPEKTIGKRKLETNKKFFSSNLEDIIKWIMDSFMVKCLGSFERFSSDTFLLVISMILDVIKSAFHFPSIFRYIPPFIISYLNLLKKVKLNLESSNNSELLISKILESLFHILSISLSHEFFLTNLDFESLAKTMMNIISLQTKQEFQASNDTIYFLSGSSSLHDKLIQQWIHNLNLLVLLLKLDHLSLQSWLWKDPQNHPNILHSIYTELETMKLIINPFYHCQIIVFLSLNDKELVRYLQILLEIELRLSINIKEEKNSIVLEIVEKYSLSKKLNLFLSEFTSLSFGLVIHHIFNYDCMILFDLLINPETSILEFLMRFFKQFTLQNMIIVVNNYHHLFKIVISELSYPKDIASTKNLDKSKSKVLCWYEEFIEETNNSKLQINFLPSLKSWSYESQISSERVLFEKYSTNEIVEKMLNFFEIFHDQLIQKSKKNLLPFQPTLLIKRVAMFINS